MPVSLRDFTLTVAQASKVRVILERRDARDPWVAAPLLEQKLLDALVGIVALSMPQRPRQGGRFSRDHLVAGFGYPHRMDTHKHSLGDAAR